MSTLDLTRPLRAPRLTIPDALTLARLTSVPILWVVAVVGSPFWLGVGVAIAAFTDVIDGPIARHSHRTTARGSQLDSIADHLLTASTALWIVWLRPAFIAEQLPLLAAWAIVGLTALLVGWVRFGRIGDLHLYSAKVAGTLGYLFAIWILLFGRYSETLFYFLVASLFVASGESLLVVTTRKTVDEHVGSIFLSSTRTVRSQGRAGVRGTHTCATSKAAANMSRRQELADEDTSDTRHSHRNTTATFPP